MTWSTGERLSQPSAGCCTTDKARGSCTRRRRRSRACRLRSGRARSRKQGCRTRERNGKRAQCRSGLGRRPGRLPGGSPRVIGPGGNRIEAHLAPGCVSRFHAPSGSNGRVPPARAESVESMDRLIGRCSVESSRSSWRSLGISVRLLGDLRHFVWAKFLRSWFFELSDAHSSSSCLSTQRPRMDSL